MNGQPTTAAYHIALPGSATTNILLTGVGGQGSVLATRIIGRAAELAGYEAVTAELHGMAQRGATVITAVRFGRDVVAPVVPRGEADFIVAFERLEALRFLQHLRPGGVLVVNDQRITPSVDALREADYPDDLMGPAAARTGTVVLVPALDIARELGNIRLVSTVVLGALSGHLDLPEAAWLTAIGEAVPPKTVDANHAAFRRGARWLAQGQG